MRDFREQNYYELLDVSPKVSQAELEESYQRAKRIFRPDSVATYALFQPDELNLLRRRIEEAFRILSDPQRRRAYDEEMVRREGTDWFENTSAELNLDAEPQEVDAGQQAGTVVPFQEPARENLAEEQQEQEEAQTVSEEPEEFEEFEEFEKVDHDQTDEETESAQLLQKERSSEWAEITAPIETPPIQLPDSVDSSLEIIDQLPQVPQVEAPVVNAQTEITGELLQQARLARSMSLEKLVDITKISIYYLRNIEEENFHDLPAPVYIRGYLRQIAQLYGLDPNLVTSGFLNRMEKVLSSGKE